MWNNKEVKKRARMAFKANYWTLVALCFVLVFLGIAQGLGGSLLSATTSSTVVKTVETGSDTTTTETNSGESVSSTNENELGIVTYLNAFLQGSDQLKNIANSVLNSFKGTGGIAYRVFYNIDRFIVTNDWAARVIIVVGFLFYLAYMFLFRNILYVGYMRTLEETRSYSKTRFMRVFSMFKAKAVWNMIGVMILREIWLAFLAVIALLPAILGLMLANFGLGAVCLAVGTLLTLGLLCIVIWKDLQLKMVPNILSISPQLSRREAFALSKEMMAGNKWHALGLNLSFAGWTILSILTCGILDIFFLRPYVYQANCELFMVLRQQFLASGSESATVLADPYLTCPEPETAEGDVNGDFGIFEQEYPKVPTEMNWLQKYITDLNPQRKYTILNLILIFFSFAIIGWLWEVFLYLVQQGRFVNRGTLHGPWLPIYGFGGIFIIILLRRFSKKPWLMALLTLLLCGVLEYATSIVLELIHNTKWWDYSNYFLNINGRVCFEGLLVFVLAGLAAVYLVGPLLDNIYIKIDKKKRITVAAILVVIFCGDAIYSHFYPNQGEGVTGQFAQVQMEECLPDPAGGEEGVKQLLIDV